MTNPVKNINLQAMSFGLALLIQTILLVGYITGIAGDVETAVRDIDRNMTRIDKLEAAVQPKRFCLRAWPLTCPQFVKAWSVWMHGRLIVISLLLAGCAKIDMPTPIALPSICMDDENCEARKNAETLASQWVFLMLAFLLCVMTPNVRGVLEVQCGSDALQYP